MGFAGIPGHTVADWLLAGTRVVEPVGTCSTGGWVWTWSSEVLVCGLLMMRAITQGDPLVCLLLTLMALMLLLLLLLFAAAGVTSGEHGKGPGAEARR